MPQIINTNVASLTAQRNLNSSQSSLATSLQRLSSGLRINSAKDDAAGLAISERMTSQIRGMNQATRNANDGISLSQTAEGALAEVGNNLQRIRELSIQSANSTNSASDRAALNSEAQQLVAEIQRVATSTQFNGLNLLDGTFASSQFQVGANANQTISVSIVGATTNKLGSYQTTSAAVTSTALDGSGLVINGTTVGASAATTAAGFTAGSAAAKAAAINAVAPTTGVNATATTTLASTVAPVKGAALSADVLQINGIKIGSVARGYDTAVDQGQAVATAINAKTNQTGVTAAADASTGKITLTSSEGRDIALTTTGATNQEATDVFNATGLTIGTVAPTAHNTETVTIAQTATFGAGGANDLADGNVLTIDGVNYEFDSNSSVTTGNVAVTVATGNSDTQVATALAASVNAQYATGNTTWSAASVAGVVTITNAKFGAEASAYAEPVALGGVANASTGTGTDATYAAATTYGKLTLSSAKNFDLSGSTAAMLTATGYTGYSVNQNTVSTLDISSLTGANSAISIIDGALQQINSSRADLGATQNRFTSTIANLQTSSENLSAARSRIQDADFAAETANLTRSQILQQAGVAMLAQANALPNNVLTLLR